MAFASFMSSAIGRVLRIIVGLVLLGWGVFLITTGSAVTVGVILAVVSLLPLGAALADVCVLAPLFGAPLSGSKVRAQAH
jgi:ABC-type protease/lipase transport system fused ATPase/permease subunit